ncbi:response regulator transcription factor [Alteromonas flava]|uniref:response regulator transcription factor n=1 Tax=Alteromonas flava TaxID=2048003 RepID=UPI000C28C789|nr:response regulator transcription factor [Alteromonas flava]
MNCLIIEDDNAVSQYIQQGLQAKGHACTVCRDGEAGLQALAKDKFEAVILDRMLPKLDGLGVLHEVRQEHEDLPVLILSAQSKVDDRVSGLRAGADDYLTKPFAFEELLARLEILVQRHGKSSSVSTPDTTIKVGDLTLNLLTREATRENQTFALKAREFRLLEFMMRNPNKVITRSMLLEHVWDYHFDPQTNIIDVHISRLRNKIDKGFSHSMIETVRGAGYRLYA